MLPSDLIKIAFYLFGIAPILAAVLAFKGPPVVRTIARFVLLVAWLGYGVATVSCLWLAFGKRPSSGIGNQVFLLFAIPLTVVGVVWFALWPRPVGTSTSNRCHQPSARSRNSSTSSAASNS